MTDPMPADADISAYIKRIVQALVRLAADDSSPRDMRVGATIVLAQLAYGPKKGKP